MTTYNDQLSQYISDLFAVEDGALQRARQDSPKRGLPSINIKPEEGKFLQFLVGACRAARALELGTLGGYSGIWIARGLSPGGKLITVERELYHARVAREHFAAAGLDDRVEIRLGNAQEMLPQLSQEGPFDFIFIDAEKPAYPSYIVWALDNLRMGGVAAAHNAFRGGRIVDDQDHEETVEVMRQVNRLAANEHRVISTIFPAGDGMLVMVKVA